MKRFLCALLAGLTLLALSGCRSAFEREYYYEAPYSGDIGPRSDKATEVRNFNMLKTALTNMISNHTEKGEFRFSNYNGNLSEDLAAACFEIKSENPLGAYAVETLSYDTSYVVSYYMANIYISYKRTAEELRSIVYTSTPEDFDLNVYHAVDSFTPGLVIRCFSPEIDEAYIQKLVKRHFFEDPTITLTEPHAAVTSYPADGPNRIFDIRFLYGYSQQRSQPMAAALKETLQEAAAEMTETEAPKIALEGARMLSERCAGGSESALYADTAYGALVTGNADSKGFALAYRALCDQLGIGCTVVEGSLGSMTTEAHYWNIIELEDAFYHVDVSGMAEDPAAAFLLSDDELWGRCIWETANYPVCGGRLTYAEVAGIPEPSEGEEPPGEEGEDEEQEPSPEETEALAPEQTEETPEEPDEEPAEEAEEEQTPEETEPTEPTEEEPDGETAPEAGEKTP